MNKMRKAIMQSALAPATLSGESGRQSFRFAESFLGFSGHFPGYPILPGVLQNLLAQVVAEQIIGQPVTFREIKRAKFSRPLRPDDRIDVEVTCREKDGYLHCATRMQVGAEEASNFTLILEESAES
ncbi:MAG: hypothetical protein C0623_03235 [Desulfuromonas sp.]|nr:MAG: hypothetical protein C0623_03235 [Desulfuromonas sp.]